MSSFAFTWILIDCNCTAVGQTEIVAGHVGADELPPPYTPSGHGNIPMINCKVCQAMINLEGKLHQHVVKCSSCNEATVS